MAIWNEQLRQLRRDAGLTRTELATRARISLDSVRSYETGRRRPTREQLSKLLSALAADNQSQNVILSDAGFAPATAGGRYAEPSVEQKRAVRLIDKRPWPTFLLNRRLEVVAVNVPAQKLIGLASRRPSRRSPDALTVAVRVAIAERCENWDELVAELIRAFKAGEPGEASRRPPSPNALPTLEAIAAGNAGLQKRFADLWQSTPAWRDRLTGQYYRVIWKAGGRSRIRFDCVIDCVNTEHGLYVHNCIPADAMSYRVLEKLLAG